METTRNRSAILAQFLRASVATINKPRARFAELLDALELIGAVADELEAVALGANVAEAIAKTDGQHSPAHSPEPLDPNTSVGSSDVSSSVSMDARVGEREPTVEKIETNPSDRATSR